MASTAESVTDYMADVQSPWLNELVETVLKPLGEQGANHPVVKAIEAGEFPRDKLCKLMSDLCWVITGFPEYVAALAARTPKNEERIKSALLENAFVEREHPGFLATMVDALGGDGQRIVTGTDWGYEFGETTHSLRMIIEAYVYHRPWIEGIAATAVGVESVTPAVFNGFREAMLTHYGLNEDEVIWLDAHFSGGVEEEHGNEGLRVLDHFVDKDDIETQRACIAGAKLVCKGISISLFDQFVN